MKTLSTTLPGVMLLELDVFGDARGRFMETYRRERYAELGIGVELVQDSLSTSVRGVLRGLHYQLANPQAKLVHVSRGEVFDVCVDIRTGSPTFRQWFGTALSEANHRQLWIPPGFAHGFYVISDVADVVYKFSTAYAANDEYVIAWNDPEIGIDWPLAGENSLAAGTGSNLGGEPLLSARDRGAPRLANCTLPVYRP